MKTYRLVWQLWLVNAKVTVDTVPVLAHSILEVKLLVADVVVDEPLHGELDLE